MDPILQASNTAALNALATTQSGAANPGNDEMMKQMIDQGSQQVLGLVLNLVMSQMGES